LNSGNGRSSSYLPWGKDRSKLGVAGISPRPRPGFLFKFCLRLQTKGTAASAKKKPIRIAFHSRFGFAQQPVWRLRDERDVPLQEL
jgi:hypothetical protein